MKKSCIRLSRGEIDEKSLITLVTLFVLVIGIYFAIGLLNSYPPSPNITVDDKKLEVARGSYCWEGLFNAACVDTISPPMLIKHHEIIPVIVSPESELKIEFKKEPEENTLGVTRLLSNNEVEDVSVNNNVLVAPKEKGVYIYDVHARWDKGDSSYAFVIEVQ
ncbi:MULTISPECIES: hypothetical protein [unclassified Mesobacillus]|uniref:hypothetical protein n=1 Tax=unclassified Mesobacillus TaxID=2675270 RepID=UPI00203ECF79|nr:MULTISPECIES: hypothetical protein [unclassified Mesobacillus]MCM3126107.1 hypothetical protein [Mesobacillus sp. MER 33]MCM3235976.1 hypothetical protein [Mesobacillus sp. MER 48]